MKVEIVSDDGTEEISFDGNTIFPYYISVLSIDFHPDKVVFRMCGKYQTRITPDYDEENMKGNYKLWIMGVNVNPVIDGGKEEKMMWGWNV